MKRHPQRQLNASGFTLIEVLLYSGIASLILFSVSSVLLIQIDGQVKQQSIQEVEQQGQFVLDHITRRVRETAVITAPAAGSSGSTLTIDDDTGVAGTDSFSESGGVLQWTDTSSTVTDMTGSTIEISDLTFTNLTTSGNSGTVQVSFILSRASSSTQQSYQYTQPFQTTVSIRSK